MGATEVPCSEFLTWLRSYVGVARAAPLPPSMLAHAADCPQCQARLFALAQATAPVPRTPCDAQHVADSPDLAAFVDLEHTDELLARQTYPHIWNHLWLCAACLDVYTRLQATLADQALLDMFGAAVPPAQPPASWVTRMPLMELDTSLFRWSIPPQALQGQMRRSMYGEDDETFEVMPPTATLSSQFKLSIDVQTESAELWRLLIQVVPPAEGRLAVEVSDFAATALLVDGRAQVEIPARYFLRSEKDVLRIALLDPPTG